MPNYLVEVYRPRLRTVELAQAGRRARAAADALTRQGIPIRFLGSISVPGDEMCLYLYEAASPASVDAATRSAAIRVERVVEAVPFGWDKPHTSADGAPERIVAPTPTETTRKNRERIR